MNKDEIWYHGTPDVREIEKEGGFTQRYINIDYVEDVDEWNRRQKAMSDARSSGDEEEYFNIIDTVGELRKNTKIRKPVFLTNVYSVAKTYSDKTAFDYQNAEEKVLKIKTKGGKGVTINAPGSRFRFIDIEAVKRGFIDAGVDSDTLDEIIKQLNFAVGVEKGIKTDNIAAIGEWLGFDYIDVVGVLDSYMGGTTKSTVRMVLDPNKIEIMKEDVLKEFVEYINLHFNSLNESDEPSPTFEWDIAKEKIYKSQKNIKNTKQAKSYLKSFIGKIKNLPKNIKSKLLKYAILFIFTLIGYNNTMEIVNEDIPELTQEIKDFIEEDLSDSDEEKIKVFKSPNSSSSELIDFLKYEEGSAKYKKEPVLTAYKLGDGAITVGWGHAERIANSKFEVGEEITKEKAEELLSADIKSAERYLNKILRDWEEEGVEYNISQNMYDSMVSLIFNMGIGNFRKSDFIKLIKKGKYKLAKEKILTTNVTWPGHKIRRQKEYEMFGKGMDLDFLALNENYVTDLKNKLSNNFKKLIDGLRDQKEETKKSFNLLVKHAKGDIDLSKAEKKQIGESIKDLFKTTGYLTVLSLPGGSVFALMLKVLKLNKYILPKYFMEESKIDKNKIISEGYKLRLKKLAGIEKIKK